MKIVMKKKDGVTLLTKNKKCDENIEIVLDAESNDNLIPDNLPEGVNVLGVVGTGAGAKESFYGNLLNMTFGSEV